MLYTHDWPIMSQYLYLLHHLGIFVYIYIYIVIVCISDWSDEEITDPADEDSSSDKETVATHVGRSEESTAQTGDTETDKFL